MALMGLLAPKSQAIATARSFSFLSFLNAYLIGFHEKDILRLKIYKPITQNISHCNGHTMLEMRAKTLFLSPYILSSGPRFA